jgi:hypothetical protein
MIPIFLKLIEIYFKAQQSHNLKVLLVHHALHGYSGLFGLQA